MRRPMQMLYIDKKAKVGEAVAKTADQVIAELETNNAALLAALQGLVSYVDRHHSVFVGEGEHESIAEARRAIAQVEGRADNGL